MLNRDEDILQAAEAWQKAGHGVALATVVETWGSAPRPAGSSLVINDDGTFLGSVSGGCVEGAVVTEALDVIASGQPKMLEFGRAYLSADFIRDQARPFLDAANRESGETVNLTVLDREDVVYVLRFPSRHVVSVNLAIGSRLPAYCTAPGRAILAYMEQGEAEAILENSPREKMTPHTVTAKSALLKILKDVRKLGFCINNQEAFIGDLSIASPVFGHAGQVLGAVNIAVPTPRWTVTQARRDLVPIVVRAAQQITETLATQTAVS